MMFSINILRLLTPRSALNGKRIDIAMRKLKCYSSDFKKNINTSLYQKRNHNANGNQTKAM